VMIRVSDWMRDSQSKDAETLSLLLVSLHLCVFALYPTHASFPRELGSASLGTGDMSASQLGKLTCGYYKNGDSPPRQDNRLRLAGNARQLGRAQTQVRVAVA